MDPHGPAFGEYDWFARRQPAFLTRFRSEAPAKLRGERPAGPDVRTVKAWLFRWRIGLREHVRPLRRAGERGEREAVDRRQ